MSVGDIIPCSDLQDAINRMDELLSDGYEVALVYGHGKAKLTILETPEGK